MAREKHMKQLRAPLGMNSDFTWKKHSHLNGANIEHDTVNSIFESRSYLDKNTDMNIKNTGKYVHKERVQYIKLPSLESFRQILKTFALSFNRIRKLHSIVTIYTVLPTNLAYIEKIKYIDHGVSLGLPYYLITIPRN